jgi:hypothetical protein
MELQFCNIGKYRLTPKVKCQAKAKVIIFDDKWVLKHADRGHNCEPNRPRVIAELKMIHGVVKLN